MCLGIEQLWRMSLGDPAVRVAIIDGACRTDLGAFSGVDLRVLSVPSVSIDESDASSLEHGTQVAGILFAGHESNVRGISPGCTGLIIPVLGSTQDDGVPGTSEYVLADAIRLALANGASIINISGGQFSVTGRPNYHLQDALDACAKADVLVVAATGNQGCDCLNVPASVEWALAVGAMNDDGNPLNISNWGDSYRKNGILAPGMNVPTIGPGGDQTLATGTSFATAVVSGVAALIKSIYRQRGKDIGGREIKELLLSTAIECPYGELDACTRFLKGAINVAGIAHVLNSGEMNMTREEMVPVTEDAQALAEHGLVNGSQGSPHGPSPVPHAAAHGPAISSHQPSGGEIASDGVVVSGGCGCGGGNGKPCTCKSNDSSGGCGCGGGNGKPCTCKSNDSSGGCGCGGGDGKPCTCKNKQPEPEKPAASRKADRVFTFGTLGFDYGTQTRRDSIAQAMWAMEGKPVNPDDPAVLVKYLEKNPWESVSIHWVLSIDDAPVYTIVPGMGFAHEVTKVLVDCLKNQVEGKADRLSVSGTIIGQSRLMSGLELPTIIPQLRGVFQWNVEEMVQAATGGEAKGEAADGHEEWLYQFLERVYYDYRNVGMSAEDRALNWAATNIYAVSQILRDPKVQGMELDEIEVKPSTIARPDSECCDVLLTFFRPEFQTTSPRRVYRVTVDVSDVVPVTVGNVRGWTKR